MHVVISEPDKFQSALRQIAGAVAKTETNPVQTAIKLKTGTDKLLMTSVDTTSHQMTLSVDVNVQVPGEILISAEHFSKVVSRLGDHVLVLESDPGSGELQIRAGGASIAFNLFPAEAEDFPTEAVFPRVAASVPGELLSEFLVSLQNGTLNKEGDVGFATIEDADKMRGYVGDSTVGLLVRCECRLTTKSHPFQFKIPYNTLRKMPAFIGEVLIHFGEDIVVFSRGDDHFLMRVANTEVDMEAYDFLFDKEPAGYIVMNLPIFKDKVGTLRVTKATQVARMTIDTDAREMMLSAHDFARGRINLPMGVADISGTTPAVLVDSACLDRAAHALGTESCIMHYLTHEGDDCDIVVLKLFDEDNPHMTQAVVLPIQE